MLKNRSDRASRLAPNDDMLILQELHELGSSPLSERTKFRNTLQGRPPNHGVDGLKVRHQVGEWIARVSCELSNGVRR
jgi:hypothetical protein